MEDVEPNDREAMTRRTKPTGAYVGSEDSFQCSAITAVRAIAASAGVDPRLCMHIPNGGQRNAIVGAKLKAQGTVAGYPDIMVHHRSAMFDLDVTDAFGQFYCGLAIELKVWPNKPSEAQEAIHALLRNAGWRVVVCYGLDEVIETTKNYFGE